MSRQGLDRLARPQTSVPLQLRSSWHEIAAAAGTAAGKFAWTTKMRKRLGVMVSLFGALLLVGNGAAANGATVAPLKALRSFDVVVEDLPTAASHCGINS